SVLLIWLNENVPIARAKLHFSVYPPLSAVVKKMLVLCVSFHFVVLAPPNSDWSLQYRHLGIDPSSSE
ncbi:hypothetical protein, partial [Alloprevotella sp. oral taxon 473]|uniref:hypothetical protein n=1 Tax=Alloprevotella sp. oral taxon 473 TaxID=712469 RepID=UPI001E4310EF